MQNWTRASLLIAMIMIAACSSKTAPAAPPTASATEGAEHVASDCSEGAPATPAHCECLGGYVKGDIGDGQVACPQGETELERVQQGIEGAVCCKASVE